MIVITGKETTANVQRPRKSPQYKNMTTDITAKPEQTARPQINVFGCPPKDSILVPDMPMSVRCNCQSGRWTTGDEELGSNASMTILKFSRYFGSLGQTQNTFWGQIFFLCEEGDLPKGVVLMTYIKTRSLTAFSQLVTSIQSQGIEPAMGIFLPKFEKYSGTVTDEQGQQKSANYYGLKWGWKERENFDSLSKAKAILDNPENVDRMFDPLGTAQMVCIDNIKPNELRRLMGAVSEQSSPQTV